MRADHERRLAHVMCLCACWLMIGAAEVYAEPSLDAGDMPDEMEAADDDLLMFSEMPVVISASRQSQPANRLSVPVSVITAEDIHYSGATNVASLLRRIPGMDVLYVDRNNPIIGVRGLHHQFSDRTLVLFNGRSKGTSFLGIDRIPIFMEDIDRIEVVRGPGGAAWGANAFNGVVNIITKQPEDAQGLFVTSQINEYGDTYSQLRWGSRAGDWSWRISAGYEGYKSSEDAITNDSFISNDFARNTRFDSEAAYQIDADTRLTFGLAAADFTHGDLEFSGFPTNGVDGRGRDFIQMLRLFARVEQELNNGDSVYLQWSGNAERDDRYAIWDLSSYENDVEAQYNTTWGEDHQLSLGGNFRWGHFRSEFGQATDMLPSDTDDEFWLGVFAIDRWEMTKRFTVEAQLRLDWYSQTRIDWSGRLSGLYGLDEQLSHVLRISVARSFRAPSYSMRRGQFSRVLLPSPPFAPGSTAINVVPNDDMKNEGVWSFEAGYNARLAEGLDMQVDGYYQIYNDLIGGVMMIPAPPASTSTIGNVDGATAYGVEAQLSWQRDQFKLTGWYAYNGFDDDRGVQNMRSFRPAPHKVGLNTRWQLLADTTVNVDYRYTSWTEQDDTLGGAAAPSVSPSHALGMTISQKLFDGRAEVMAGVSDLLDDTSEAVQQIGALTAHETPGRTFFVRLQATY